MTITCMESYKRLKAMRARMAEFELAIEKFEGELMELGALRAKHYAIKFRADELAAQIRARVNHES